jgi:diguanylate cyclase (GGDEF)-like protein
MNMYRTLVNRFGASMAIVVLTLVSILVSLGFVFLIVAVFREPLTLSSLLLAVVIPLVLVPFFSYSALNYSTQLKTAEETLQLLAETDPLTTASNRRFFIDCAENEFALAQRHGGDFSIILLDIDDYKHVSDTYGHKAGDHVLRALAEICQGQTRRTDIFARYGDTQFACLLPHTPNIGAVKFAARVQQMIASTTFNTWQHQIRITVSVGVKTREDETDLDSILRAAEKALAMAEEQGKNHLVSIPSQVPDPVAV